MHVIPKLPPAILAAAAIALAAPAHADAYHDGYNDTKDYYSQPKNHQYYLDQQHDHGYAAGITCQSDVVFQGVTSGKDDWIRGCIDALHDLGLK